MNGRSNNIGEEENALYIDFILFWLMCVSECVCVYVRSIGCIALHIEWLVQFGALEHYIDNIYIK